MQKLSEATQQKLADANAVAEADASCQLQLDKIDDPRHPDVWDFRKTLDVPGT